MLVLSWTSLVVYWLLSLKGAESVSIQEAEAKPFATCNGVPCVCYDELGCFPVRPECGENDNSPLPDPPVHVDTKFFLYTSKSQTTGKPLNYNMKESDFIGAGFDKAVETKLLIHGFNNDADSPAAKSIKDAFLNTGNYNVIIVEWQTGLYYPQAVQDTRIVAKQIQLLAQALSGEVGVQLGYLHLTGHSLGAHIAGLAGAHLGGAVGRITGLDPAGPDYRRIDPSCRIDASDAVFVDIIHTDKSNLGTDDQCGDVDFWPNDGDNQPGCGIIDVGCSHGRAFEYFAISIEGFCVYTTNECYTSCSDCPIMGIDAERSSSKIGNFCITMANGYPFC